MRRCIVLFDDEQGLQTPMGWDAECEGAISAFSKEIAVFDTRKDAQTAISISARWAELQRAQGKPHNEDFTNFRRMLRIVPLKGKGGAA